MLQAFSQFLSEHMIAGAFLLFLLFIIVSKLDRLANHWIDGHIDEEREYRRERRERLEHGGAHVRVVLLLLFASTFILQVAAKEKHPITVTGVKQHETDTSIIEAVLIKDGSSGTAEASAELLSILPKTEKNGWHKYTIYCEGKCAELGQNVYSAYAEQWPLRQKTHIKITVFEKSKDFSKSKAVAQDWQVADNAWSLDWEQ